MADLNAKESTQETLMTLIGMSLGIALAKQLRTIEEKNRRVAFQVVWMVFIVLTVIHVWANYRGVTMLKLKTLNRERAEVALKQVVEKCAAKVIAGTPVDEIDLKHVRSLVLSPDQVSESVLSSTWKLIFGGSIHLGVRISEFHQEICVKGSCAFEDLVNTLRVEKYLLGVSTTRKAVFVALRCGADQRDEFKAFLLSMIAQRCLESVNAFGLATEQQISIVRR